MLLSVQKEAHGSIYSYSADPQQVMGPDPIDKAKSKLIYSKDLLYDGGIENCRICPTQWNKLPHLENPM